MEARRPGAPNSHLFGRLAEALALVVAELDQMPFTRGQSGELAGDENVHRVFRFNWNSGHCPTVPVRVGPGLARLGKFNIPVDADSLDAEASVGAAAEPMLGSDTIQ